MGSRAACAVHKRGVRATIFNENLADVTLRTLARSYVLESSAANSALTPPEFEGLPFRHLL